MSNINIWQQIISRFSSGFVLAFHQISAERLARFIDCLRPAEAVHLAEMVQRSKQRKSTRGLFAITLDDGVGDTVRTLSPIFNAKGWPATFYLSTQYVDTGEGLAFQWWRRLKPFLPKRRLELKSGVLDLSRPGSIDELAKRMEQNWHSQRIESYLPLTMELVDIVMRETGMTREALQPAAPITWAEVEQLSKNDLLRFESHCVRHAAVSSLTEEELLFEMKHSQAILAERTGRECRHLAYPFGSWQSIGARAAAVAERFYDSATTMSLGHVDGANPWLLPRIPLYPENSTLRARLKVLLKCTNGGRLPPPAESRSAMMPLVGCHRIDRRSLGGAQSPVVDANIVHQPREGGG